MTVVTMGFLAAALAVSPPDQSDSTKAARVAPARAQVRAVRLSRPAEIDGQLRDEVWQSATRVGGFVQRDPEEGKAATESTVVWVAYDDGALYVAARLYDSKPDSIISRLGRRDDYTGGDRFTFYVDSYHDRRSGFYFAIDAAGTLSDGILYNDDWNDNSWDGVWEGKSLIDSLGWVVEMRIPYSQLRFSKAASYTWGVNFQRELIRKNEFSYFVLRPKNSSGFVSRFADLTGIEQITPPRRLELMPYVTSRAEFLPGGNDLVPGLGGDARIGLGSNITMNLTVNPDFGQVEVDPAVVNLSDQEIFLNERRPFFVEGSATFDFGFGGQRNFWGFNWPGPDLYYTRRIGAGGTNILGAMKLTGKVAGSWNVGAVSALTSREVAVPLTFYGAYRAQKEFPEGRQGLGLMGTVAKRDFDALSSPDAYNSSAMVAGADGWVFLDSSKTWVTTGWVGVSRIGGTAARITSVQLNPIHYFQQPDGNSVEVDPAATSMSGFAARWTLAKQKGASFVNAAVGAISPGFDVNDLGLMSTAGILNWHAGAGRTWTKAGKLFRYREMLGALFGRYDWDLNTTGLGIWGSTFVEFTNYWWGNVSVAYNPPTVSNRRTRGGPLTRNLPGLEFNGNAGSDGRKKWSFNVWGGGYYQRAEQYDWWSGSTLNYRPASNITISVGPSLSGGRTLAQYVGKYFEATADATYDTLYVFKALERTELSASIRVNWTFSPKLSFQLYAQPLISAVEYGDPRALQAPRTYDFDVYSVADGRYDPATTTIYPNGPSGSAIDLYPGQPDGFIPDFNFRSLRGNAVLRWEYLPGSTLFLVWTHGRSDEADYGAFALRESLGRLFAHQPDNMFMVKVSYYWNP